MELLNKNPFDLVPNKFNSNKVDRENFEKLKKSLTALDCFKPVICRTVNGTLEILAGFHRVEAAKELGWKEVPVLNLGIVDEDKAREICIIDNRRYGIDDVELLEKIMGEISDLTVLSEIVPEEVLLDAPEIDLTEMEPKLREESKQESGKTLRFKYEDADKAEEIETILARTAYDNDFKYSDGYSNMAEALYYLLVIKGNQ